MRAYQICVVAAPLVVVHFHVEARSEVEDDVNQKDLGRRNYMRHQTTRREGEAYIHIYTRNPICKMKIYVEKKANIAHTSLLFLSYPFSPCQW